MTLIPSRPFLLALVGVGCSAVGLLIVPDFWPILVVADLALFLVAGVDLLMTPRPGAVRAVRLAVDRMSVHQKQRVTIRVGNSSKLALRVTVRDAGPVGFLGEAELGGPVPALGEARWEYEVTPTARGRFEWGPIYFRYRSALGFWQIGKREPAAAEARVYPNLTMLDRYHLLARSNRLDAIGIRRVRLRSGSTEFDSLREYAAGDDVRQLDWKATARRARLIVRNQEAERNQTVLLVLDSGRLMNATEDGVSKLDQAVTTTLLLANVALARGDRVGLCTFSAKPGAWLAPRGNQAQNRLIGETLYDLRGDYSESDHERCLRFVACRHPKRSLLVVLTDFVDGTTAADMVTHLQLASRRHVVLFVALKDAFLDRAAAAADPATEREGFRKAAAIDLLRDRRAVLEKIRHAGGFVVDAEPGAIAPLVINRYLEVMFGGLL
ncbi:MAG TPA: DUF58 domain-containing protein [Fimbriiglobus sp.]|jgi:uncharacterized protein (DUF58 family)